MEEQEMPCDGRKRELAEEDEEEVDDSNDSGKSHYAYDSDDSDFELIDGTKVDPKGFDITVYPGASFNSSIVPLKSYLTDPNKKQKYTDLCGLAIGDFNSQSAKKYEFVEIVTVNASFAAGM
ncbi:uncharacterized protein LOC107769492 [Nicotiana tabacum]|uniref:Uncharacterized protein LOC107769492 n=1 Tax=Nicotiana tabacum TaxID=4097 RepID=A0AC58U113_TOBAC